MSDLKFIGVNYPSIPVQRQGNPLTDALLVDLIRPTGGGSSLGLKVQPYATASAGTDILFDVKNFAGVSQFSVNAQGDIAVAGASTVSGGPSFIAGALTLGGNVTVGNDASDTITLARHWTSNATNLSYASSMIIDPGGSTPAYGTDGTVRIVIGSGGDPTITGTTVDNPPAGSLLLQTNGTAYLKTASGATAWALLATGGAVTLDSVINAGSPDNTVSIPAGDPLVFNGTGTFTVNASIGSNLTFLKEANHTISVDTSTTTSAAGGNLTISAGTGAATSGVGGDLTLQGGSGNGNTHGGVFITSARTAATQGPALTVTQASVAAGIFVGTADPSAGGGVIASEGSLFLRDAGTAGSLFIKTGAANTAWTQVSTGGASSLQSTYVAGNTISVTSGEGSFYVENTTDTTDAIQVSRTFVGSGDGIQVDMGPGAQAVTGSGIRVVMGSASTGTGVRVESSGTGSAAYFSTLNASISSALYAQATGTGSSPVLDIIGALSHGGISSSTVDSTSGLFASTGLGTALYANSDSTGNIFDARDSNNTVFLIEGTGAISANPTAGQNFFVQTLAAGGAISLISRANISNPGLAGDINIASIASDNGQTAGNILIGSTSLSGGDPGGIAIFAGVSASTPAAREVTIDANNISIDSFDAANFTVTDIAADLTLGARAATITLNEAGDESLVGFTATSIVGALNEVKASAGPSSQVVVGGFDTTTNSLVDGDLGYLTTTANRVQKAIATSLAAASVFGANEGTVSSMTIAGTIENQNVEASISIAAGDRLYLSATQAGSVTNVPPSTSGQVVAFVGFARTSNGGAGADVSMLMQIQPPILI